MIGRLFHRGGVDREPHLKKGEVAAVVKEGSPRARIDAGEIVMYFQCDGCMAHNHELRWVGVVDRFERRPGRMALYYAIVKIIKCDHQDWRDVDLGETRVAIEDGALQRLAPNLLAVFK